MKFKKIIFGLVSILGIGAAVGVANIHNQVNEAKEAKADGTSGSLICKLGNIAKWSEGNAKLCAYLTDDSSTYWTSLQTLSSSTSLYKFDYTISFTPTKLIWVRMNPAATSGNWNQKWNQTGDLSWNEATYLQNQWDPTTSQCSQWTVSAQVRSNQVTDFGTKQTLSTIGINGYGNPEVSGSVSLIENEEFKILAGDGVWSGYYGTPSALSTAISGGSTTERSDDNPNIVCEIAGTYDFYFDTETKKLWISRQDIVDADGWATTFNNNVGCDPTGVDLPTGWSTVSSAYSSLSNDAKDYIYAGTADVDGDNLARALATYDYAVSHHASLEKFIKNSSNAVRTSSSNYRVTVFEINNTNGAAPIIVSVIAVLALTAVGGYYFLSKNKKKKEN